jgi:hypothetical protein
VLAPNAKAPQRGQPIDFLFDAAHLNETLATHCPQLKLHRSMDDLWEVSSLLHSKPLSLQHVEVLLRNGSIITHPELIHSQVAAYVERMSPVEKRRHPVRFHMAATYFAWPTDEDPVVLARNFGRILRVRDDARRLAAAAIFNMARRFKLRVEPRAGNGGIRLDNSYVAAHLRVEEDAGEKFPLFDRQASSYLSFANQAGVDVLFLATGANEANVSSFKSRSRDFNLTVVTKADLLEDKPEERGALSRLTYDQRALVDHEIMLRSGLLTGFAASAFAWDAALRRRNAFDGGAKAGAKKPLQTSTYPNLPIEWRDAFSILFGPADLAAAMLETMWP